MSHSKHPAASQTPATALPRPLHQPQHPPLARQPPPPARQRFAGGGSRRRGAGARPAETAPACLPASQCRALRLGTSRLRGRCAAGPGGTCGTSSGKAEGMRSSDRPPAGKHSNCRARRRKAHHMHNRASHSLCQLRGCIACVGGVGPHGQAPAQRAVGKQLGEGSKSASKAVRRASGRAAARRPLLNAQGFVPACPHPSGWLLPSLQRRRVGAPGGS